MLADLNASVRGGGLRDWVINAHVARGSSRTDLDTHAHEMEVLAGVAGLGVGMFTAVDVRTRWAADVDGASVVATVGRDRSGVGGRTCGCPSTDAIPLVRRASRQLWEMATLDAAGITQQASP